MKVVAEASRRGIVYVFSNPAMADYVKIGRIELRGTTPQDDIQRRLRELDTTGVLLAFDCEYAVVVEDAPGVEMTLHEAFGKYRTLATGSSSIGCHLIG